MKVNGYRYLITEETSGAATSEHVTSTETLAENPVEALVHWARLDHPHRRHLVLRKDEGRPLVEEPLQHLLFSATWYSHRDEDRLKDWDRMDGALADWLLRHVFRHVIPGVAADGGADPLALQRAGWAWALRMDEPVPGGVLERLGSGHRSQVQRGAEQISNALTAGLHPGELRLSWLARAELYDHWKVLAGAAAHVPDAAVPARELLDTLIAVEPDTPTPPRGAQDADLRATAARIWFLTREHQPDLAQVFRCVADPASTDDRPLRALFAALPEYLKQNQHIADEILLAAEKLGSAHALHSRYDVSYPTDELARFRDAVDNASQALFAMGTAAAMAANLQALPAGPGASDTLARVRPQAHAPAQQAGVQPPQPAGPSQGLI